MKRFAVIVSVLFTSQVEAHSLSYTLRQDGFTRVALCSPASSQGQGPKVGIFQRGKLSFVLLESQDEDAGRIFEHIASASKASAQHDREIYQAEDFTFEIARVGENPIPGTLDLKKADSALGIWLKTYSVPNMSKRSQYNCELK